MEGESWAAAADSDEPANSELSANGTPRFSVQPIHLAFLPDFASPRHVTPTKGIQREKYYTVPQPVTRKLAVSNRLWIQISWPEQNHLRRLAPM